MSFSITCQMNTASPSKLARLSAYLRLMKDMAKQGHLPVARQTFEMVLLFVRRGLGPGYYLFGRFWRREVPLRSKLRHLNERSYAKRINRINKPKYQKLSQNKIAEKALYSLFSIPTPRFLGHIHPLEGLACDSASLRNGDDLEKLLLKERPQTVCFKLVEGWGGAGFRAARVDYNNAGPRLTSLTDQTSLDPAQFVSETLTLKENSCGYIVEEFCQQHPWYSTLNPTSVNTFRVYAMCPPGGPAKILGSYLRVGRRDSITDNASAGGLLYLIDIQSGVIGPGVLNEIASPEYSAHPDSGIQIEGCQAPYWDAVCEIVPKAMAVFPYTQFAGLDIAVTEQGPVLIEINCQPDRTGACDIDMSTLDMITP